MLNLLRRSCEGLLSLLDVLPASVSLTVVAVVTGAALLLIVRYTTPQKWVEIARARMSSAIYETRLFLDNPARVLIAQGRLALWSALYIGTMIPAFVLAAVPLGLLYLHLEARHGLEPLPLHRDVVVRVFAEDADAIAFGTWPEGVKATAAPVRARTHSGEVVFQRLQVERPEEFDLELFVEGQPLTKRLSADPAAPRSPERARGFDLLASLTTEPALPGTSSVQRISTWHEPSTQTWLGLPWWGYWLGIATASALILKRPLGVSL